jgi:hypothetical protein
MILRRVNPPFYQEKPEFYHGILNHSSQNTIAPDAIRCHTVSMISGRCRAAQLVLPGLNRGTRALARGGEATRGRKTRRPFDRRQALHVVLRSSKARGELSMLHPRHCNPIRALVARLKARWGVSVYRYANVGNHLHLLIRARSRAQWQGFIRELAGGVAMLVTGARKGSPLSRSRAPGLPESARRGFWDHLVFTRIVSWGRDFRGVADYLCRNLWEAAGVPVGELIARGFRILWIDERGAVLAHRRANPALLRAAFRPG